METLGFSNTGLCIYSIYVVNVFYGKSKRNKCSNERLF